MWNLRNLSASFCCERWSGALCGPRHGPPRESGPTWPSSVAPLDLFGTRSGPYPIIAQQPTLRSGRPTWWDAEFGGVSEATRTRDTPPARDLRRPLGEAQRGRRAGGDELRSAVPATSVRVVGQPAGE